MSWRHWATVILRTSSWARTRAIDTNSSAANRPVPVASAIWLSTFSSCWVNEPGMQITFVLGSYAASPVETDHTIRSGRSIGVSFFSRIRIGPVKVLTMKPTLSKTYANAGETSTTLPGMQHTGHCLRQGVLVTYVYCDRALLAVVRSAWPEGCVWQRSIHR